MSEADEISDVPEGAAVFPHIPEELLVNPLLLAVVHSIVFFVGSDEDIVQPDAADEALDRISEYLQRLQGEQLRQVKEDMATLVAFAKDEKWDRPLILSLRNMLSDLGVGEEAEEEAE